MTLKKFTNDDGDSYVIESFTNPNLKYETFPLNYMSRIRGFEKISEGQWYKDTSGSNTDKKDKTCKYSDIVLPHRKTAKSAGYDVISTLGFTLEVGEAISIPTGFKAYMLDDEKLIFHPRSSLGFKYFVRFANTTPVGDSDYFNNESNEGHYWIKIRNEGDKPFVCKIGDAVAQCIFEKYLLADGDDFSGNKRKGGIGSTTVSTS